MEGDLPPQAPALLVLLERNNCDSLWFLFLLQIQRSKVKSSIWATTNQPSTGMMKQPRWQECGTGRERVASCRLKVLTRRGGTGLSDMFLRAWWPFFLLSLFLTSSLSCLMSPPGLQAASPETLPQPDLWQWVQVRPQREAPGG